MVLKKSLSARFEKIHVLFLGLLIFKYKILVFYKYINLIYFSSIVKVWRVFFQNKHRILKINFKFCSQKIKNSIYTQGLYKVTCDGCDTFFPLKCKKEKYKY